MFISSNSYSIADSVNSSNLVIPPKSSDRGKFDRAFQNAAAAKEKNKKENQFKLSTSKKIVLKDKNKDDSSPSKFLKKKRLDNAELSNEEKRPLKLIKTTRHSNLDEKTSEFRANENTYSDIYHKAELMNEIIIGNQKFNIKRFASGSYSYIYNIVSTEVELISGVSNDHLVIKLADIKKKNELDIGSHFDSSINNYRDAMNLKLPVATIFNLETAADDKYVIQEKIPGKFSFHDNAHFQQLRSFFLASLKNNLMLDLHPGNLLVRENGELTLIDFVEDESRGLTGYINTALKFWCAKGIEKMGWDREAAALFLSQLTKDFENYDVKIDVESILKRNF